MHVSRSVSETKEKGRKELDQSTHETSIPKQWAEDAFMIND